jgi:hypothetical protein
MSNELVQYGDGGAELSLWRPPEQVLAEAKQAAVALKAVIDAKPLDKRVVFNNETYLEFEDWQTVAKFYGCTSKVISSKFVEYGGVRGFEAEAVVLDRNQNEIGRAESMCLSDEENWGDVPKYKWEDELDATGRKQWVEGKNGKKGYYKGKRVVVGSAPKPLFQLRSMAQTRAAAKAIRSVFSWVVVLAGYKPTVAEEMTGNEFPEERKDQAPPPSPNAQRKSTKAAEPPKPETVICSECRVTNGHSADCKYFKKPDSNAQASTLTPMNAEVQSPETKDKKQEATFLAYKDPETGEAHDPAKHVNWKQSKLIYVIQRGRDLKLDAIKDWLKENTGNSHIPLLESKYFSAVLDALDPDFEYHEAKNEPPPAEEKF